MGGFGGKIWPFSVVRRDFIIILQRNKDSTRYYIDAQPTY